MLFADILANCQPNTRLCVACNLTAPDAFVRTMTIREWKTRYLTYKKTNRVSTFVSNAGGSAQFISVVKFNNYQ